MTTCQVPLKEVGVKNGVKKYVKSLLSLNTMMAELFGGVDAKLKWDISAQRTKSSPPRQSWRMRSNDWLRNNPGIQIHHIQQSAGAGSMGPLLFCITVSVPRTHLGDSEYTSTTNEQILHEGNRLNQSVIAQLIYKDLQKMKLYVLAYLAGGLVPVVAAVVLEYNSVQWADSLLLSNVIGTLVSCAMGGAGLHALMQTTIEDKGQLPQPPVVNSSVTVREYTVAKLIANYALFGSVWLVLSVGIFTVFFGENGFPKGSVPMASIILVGIFLAYTVILGVSIMTKSKRYTIIAILLVCACTSLYLNLAGQSFLMSAFAGGSQVVWHSSAVDILLVQVASVVVFLFFTVIISFEKKASI